MPIRAAKIASQSISVLALALTFATTSAVEAQQSRRRVAEHVEAKPLSTKQMGRGEHVETRFQFPVGSIVIVNSERRLYYITGKGEAVRYRVAVGKSEELWMGRTFVAAKVVDPKWIPVNGDDPVEGGDAANPLGKRALYLDWSLLRIHGTPSRGSIGSAVSNGCIRMLNEDVIDLFDRVHYGASVYAIPSWREPSLYEDLKVGEKVYANPEGHEQAKEELEEQKRERGLYGLDKETRLRRNVRPNVQRVDPYTTRIASGKFRGKVALGRRASDDDED